MEPSILNVNKCSYEELAEVVQSTRIAAAILGLRARYGTVTVERLAEIVDLPPEVMPFLDCTPADAEVGPSTSHTLISENPQGTAPLPSENTPIHLHSGPSGQQTTAPSKDHLSYYPWDKYPPPKQKTGTGKPRATGPTDTQPHQGTANFPRGGSVGETPLCRGYPASSGNCKFPPGRVSWGNPLCRGYPASSGNCGFLTGRDLPPTGRCLPPANRELSPPGRGPTPHREIPTPRKQRPIPPR